MKKKTYISTNGKGERREVLEKPANWAARTRSEGRSKTQRAKKIKLKSAYWPRQKVLDVIGGGDAGEPTSQTLVTCNNPKRKLTCRDVLMLFRWSVYPWQPRFNTVEDQVLEVKHSDDNKFIEFEDLTGIIDIFSHLPLDDNPNL